MKVKTIICYPQQVESTLNKVGYDNVKQIIPFYQYRCQQQETWILIIYEVKEKSENKEVR